MLFRVLLVLNVLFASAEGAPIFIRNPRSQEQIGMKEENITVPPKTSEDAVYRIVIPAAVLSALAVIIRAIATICRCLKKKTPTKDAESQYCADDFRESNTKLNEDYEFERTITNEDAPHGPEAEKGDFLKDNNIIMAHPTDREIPTSLDGNVVIASDRKHEDDVPITTDDSPHGPGTEQRDVLTGNKISVPGPPDVVIDISPDEEEVTSSDREFDIFCTSGDITMPHKADIVEAKESKISADFNDHKQTPPSILKGRNQLKNKNTGKIVSFQDSDYRYVYTFDSESSQPGRQIIYFRNKQGGWKNRYRNPSGGDNFTTTPLHGGYQERIRQPVMTQKRPMDMTLTRLSAVRCVHGHVTYLQHSEVDSGLGLCSHPWV
ncbi:uncharacterized protein LOC143784820 [Ranitomeya variabilis]|uniref:uncharacterized protein LOC143784820 n=1 Tax=Ranitomeya variabilis TaxID=490064 RepID=UPI0040562ABC